MLKQIAVLMVVIIVIIKITTNNTNLYHYRAFSHWSLI